MKPNRRNNSDYLTHDACVRIVMGALHHAHASPEILRATPFKIAALFNMIEEDIEERGGIDVKNRAILAETPASIMFDTGNGKKAVSYTLQAHDEQHAMIHRQHLGIFAPSLALENNIPEPTRTPRAKPSTLFTSEKLDKHWVPSEQLHRLLLRKIPQACDKRPRHEILLRMIVRNMYDKFEGKEGTLTFTDSDGKEREIHCQKYERRGGKSSVAVHQDDLENFYVYAQEAYTQRNAMYLDRRSDERQI